MKNLAWLCAEGAQPRGSENRSDRLMSEEGSDGYEESSREDGSKNEARFKTYKFIGKTAATAGHYFRKHLKWDKWYTTPDNPKGKQYIKAEDFNDFLKAVDELLSTLKKGPNLYWFHTIPVSDKWIKVGLSAETWVPMKSAPPFIIPTTDKTPPKRPFPTDEEIPEK